MPRPVYKKTRLRKERKSIPLRAGDRGTGRQEIDAGKYFRCWNCGFICNIDRDALGEGSHGAIAVLTERASEGSSPGDPLSAVVVIDGTGILDVCVPKVDAAGVPVVIIRSYDVDGTGCPLCHTRAWKK